MTNRVNTRVESPMEVSVHCENGTVYRGVVKNLSISGVKITVSKIYDLGPCSNGILKMQVGARDNPYIAEIFGKLVRYDHDSIVYELVESDIQSFNRLKRAILDNADDPAQVITEIQSNSDVSINSMYVPAMKDAVANFVVSSTKEIFKVFLGQDVSVTHTPPILPDIVVSGISSFNGALYGNIVLTSDMGFSREVIAKLLETDKKYIDDALIIDGFGELTNMISGGVQTGLHDEYENLTMIPPMVFIGSQCRYGSDQLFSVKINFASPSGRFFVDALFSIV